MSRIEELEKQITELDERKVALQKKLKLEKQKTNVEYPFEEDKCWWVNSFGETISFIWVKKKDNTQIYDQGHIFKTKQEAERESDRRALLTRFRQFRDKCNGDWKPFECDHQFYLSFDTMTNVIHINCVYINKSFALFGYFKKKSDAERAIELFGDEIKRLWVDE